MPPVTPRLLADREGNSPCVQFGLGRVLRRFAHTGLPPPPALCDAAIPGTLLPQRFHVKFGRILAPAFRRVKKRIVFSLFINNHYAFSEI